MINGIVFIIVFIIGFAFGIAMPFILFKFPFRVKEGKVEEKNPKSSANDILTEWLNGEG